VTVYRREADGTWRRAVETFHPDALPIREFGPGPAAAPALMEG
jgi:hypothetical protein